MHPYSYKQPVNIHYSSFYSIFLMSFAQQIFGFYIVTTDMYNQLCMYNHVHMFPPYANFIHFEKLLLDSRS